MSVITLITDWAEGDFYLGVIKGFFQKKAPKATIIDFFHYVPNYSIVMAGFILKNNYKHFPPDSIHLIGIKSVQEKNSYLAARYDNQYFICADNGLLGLVFERSPEKLVKIKQTSDLLNFPELSILAEAAAKLANGIAIEELGELSSNFVKAHAMQPSYDEKTIKGKVLYVDSYGNVITNIDKELFEKQRNGRRFEILLHSMRNKVEKISNHYYEFTDLGAIFNSLGLIEIAMNEADVAKLLSLDKNSSIIVKFYDNTNSKNDLSTLF